MNAAARTTMNRRRLGYSVAVFALAALLSGNNLHTYPEGGRRKNDTRPFDGPEISLRPIRSEANFRFGRLLYSRHLDGGPCVVSNDIVFTGASADVEAPVHSRHVQLVGTQECTYGPSFWCKNLT